MKEQPAELEGLEDFRQRARAWLGQNMPRQNERRAWIADDMARWQRAREFQRTLFDDVRIAAEAPVRHLVRGQTARRVTAGMASGHFPPTSGALLRLMGARSAVRRADIAIEIAGAGAAAWQRGDTTGPAGVRFLARQGSELGGGSTEIQRNIIGERVLGMPREYAADRDVLFSQVRRNAMPTRG